MHLHNLYNPMFYYTGLIIFTPFSMQFPLCQHLWILYSHIMWFKKSINQSSNMDSISSADGCPSPVGINFSLYISAALTFQCLKLSFHIFHDHSVLFFLASQLHTLSLLITLDISLKLFSFSREFFSPSPAPLPASAQSPHFSLCPSLSSLLYFLI